MVHLMLSRTQDAAARPTGVVVVLAVAAALILAFVLAEVVSAGLRGAGHRAGGAGRLARRLRNPVRAVLVVALVWAALVLVSRASADSAPWRHTVDQAMAVAGVAALAGLAAVLTAAAVDSGLAAPGAGGRGGARTGQATAVRRLLLGVVVLAALVAALLVVDVTRSAGTVGLVLLALVVVVLLAAVRRWLADIVAGVQLSVGDALRVGDVVVVDGEWGRVEEVRATYVVVQAWDDRRVVVPTSRLTATSFENWTRRAADLVGAVDLDVDWAVPVPAMRAELQRLVQGNDLWDRRVAVLQVVDATGGRVRVRAVVSAAEPPALYDLRCDVREGLVAWVARQTDAAVPAASPSVASPAPGDTVQLDPRRDARLFTGSMFAVERSRAFTGPGPEAIAEREAGAD